MILYIFAGLTTSLVGLVTFLVFYTTKNKVSLPDVQSEEVKEESKEDNHGLPRRGTANLEKIPHSTVHDTFKAASQKYAKKNLFGTRSLLDIVKEEKEVNGQKKTWEYFKLGPYQWLTFEEAFEKTLVVGAGLRALGMEPGDFLGIYEDTRLEWSLIYRACFAHSMIATTIYANLGAEAVVFAMKETKMKYIFTNGALLSVMANCINEGELKAIIYTDKPDEKGKETLKSRGITVISFDEIEKMGTEKPREAQPPKPDDTAVVMYTSGSTGNPKGVVITHSNLVAASFQTLRGSAYKVHDDDTYISFLPLAHVLALVAESAMLTSGVAIGYSNPRSLTDSMVRQCKGDLTELRPTLMAGVPTIYDRIKKGAREKVEKSGALTKHIFDIAYSLKGKAISKNHDTPFWNLLVFNKFKEQLGGRMRIMLSGGAPISRDTHEFLRICFSCSVIQGYGLTETCGGGTIQHVEDPKLGRVGSPLPGISIKLVDCEEMGYKHTDKPYPRGEIWIRGPNVATNGYYNNPEQTAKDFKEGGWFATGDVGQWGSDGTLQIVDRVKNLIKLSMGEYIALESLESKFKNSAFVDNICVFGDSEQSYVVSLVFPAKSRLTEWAHKNNIPDADDWEKLCKNRKARNEVLSSVVAAGKAARMKTVELPKDVFLCSEEWTPQNGMLTAALKLKRSAITQNFKKEIEQMYKETSSS